jgi:fatty-acyl-CoA synthase
MSPPFEDSLGAARMHPTPTTHDLPVRRGDFGSLPEALDYAARGQTGFNFYSARGELTAVLTYAELQARAVATARGLVAAGLPPLSRVVLVADTNPDFLILFMACQYAGLLAVPVSLPTTLGGHEAYVAGLRRQLLGSGAAAAAAPAELLEFLREAAAGLKLALVGAPADFYALPAAGADPRPFRAGDPSYLQFSSGSTRFPLGVDIRQAALVANVRAMVESGVACEIGDRGTSWLPLYHDMGLVGFVLGPLLHQGSVDLIPTRDFARRPLVWLTVISRNRGTVSYSPSFGYELAAQRAVGEAAAALDLSCWRIAGIGGDMIQAPVLERFAATFAAAGFQTSAYVPSYGMAEATLGVSFAPLGRGFALDHVDRDRLAEAAEALPADPASPVARGFVRCGQVLPGHRLEIRGEDGRALPERRLGRVFFHGPSVMAGYYGEPEATARVLDAEGWLDTGDLGYMVEGEVVITGRSKDLIIVNGRNIWPQDVEWAVEAMPGLRRGDVAAFSLEAGDAGERLVLLVQCREQDPERRADLAREVEGLVRRTVAVEPQVVLIPARGLPHTSSGKLSRSRARANYLSGAYGEAPVAAAG